MRPLLGTSKVYKILSGGYPPSLARVYLFTLFVSEVEPGSGDKKKCLSEAYA